jgi:hypothetical protein
MTIPVVFLQSLVLFGQVVFYIIWKVYGWNDNGRYMMTIPQVALYDS